ncbi:MAG: hypothetical protein ACTSXP_04665, partial [Promethearchaeota archaeon]
MVNHAKCPDCNGPLDDAVLEGKSVICKKCGAIVLPKINKAGRRMDEKSQFVYHPRQNQPCNPFLSKQTRHWHVHGQRNVQNNNFRSTRFNQNKNKQALRGQHVSRQPFGGAGIDDNRNKAILNERLQKFKTNIIKYNNKFFLAIKIITALIITVLISFSIFHFFNAIFYPVSINIFIFHIINTVPSFIALIVFYYILAKKLHPTVARGEIKHYGIDFIMLGIIGCVSWGLGIFSIIEGLAIMNFSIKRDKLFPRKKRDILLEWLDGLESTAKLLVLLATAYNIHVLIFQLLIYNINGYYLVPSGYYPVPF